MFELEAAINSWRENLERQGITRRDSLTELESHLREQLAQLQGHGLSDAERFMIAVNRMGDAPAIQQEFSKVERQRFKIYWNNPWSLHMASALFLAAGVDSWTGGFTAFSLPRDPCTWLTAIWILPAVGLLCRSNFWRLNSLFSAGVVVWLSGWQLLESTFKFPFQHDTAAFHYTKWDWINLFVVAAGMDLIYADKTGRSKSFFSSPHTNITQFTTRKSLCLISKSKSQRGARK